ncbi:MAG: IPT/TIG domain-containing protein [Agriterribacter sp.]
MLQKIQKANLIYFCILFVLITQNCKRDHENKPANPTLTSIDPTDGIIGDPVVLKGTNLGSVDKIMFGSVTSPKIQGTSTSITTVVPAGIQAGSIKVLVQAAASTSSSLDFTVLKEPDHVDNLPPNLNMVVPSATYSEYPLLIYGNNLSGVIKITFNDKEAVVYTNNTNVITTAVPKDIPAGPVSIKIRTVKGTSTINFQVQGAPPIPPSVNFNIISTPPPNYVPGISNQWSCGLLAQVTGDQKSGTLVDLNSNDGNDNFSITGKFEYDFDKSANYNTKNYVEIINHNTKDTLSGQFSSKFDNPCILQMVLISSKTKTISTCTFDRRSNDENLQCEQ